MVVLCVKDVNWVFEVVKEIMEYIRIRYGNLVGEFEVLFSEFGMKFVCMFEEWLLVVVYMLLY